MLGMITSANRFDVAIGCELLYREDSVAALVETVCALGVGTVVLAQQTRPAGTTAIEDECRRQMTEAGFTAAQVPVEGTPAVIYTFSCC